jgi:hypothetical protein
MAGPVLPTISLISKINHVRPKDRKLLLTTILADGDQSWADKNG